MRGRAAPGPSSVGMGTALGLASTRRVAPFASCSGLLVAGPVPSLGRCEATAACGDSTTLDAVGGRYGDSDLGLLHVRRVLRALGLVLGNLVDLSWAHALPVPGERERNR